MSHLLTSLTAISMLLLFVSMVSCGISSAWDFSVMRAEVNSRLSRSEHISSVGGHFFKYQRVWKLHREMYPASTLRRQLWRKTVVCFACFICLAWLDPIRRMGL